MFDDFDWNGALADAFGTGAQGGPPLPVQPAPPPTPAQVIAERSPTEGYPQALPTTAPALPRTRPPDLGITPGTPPGDMAWSGPPTGVAAAPLPPPVTVNRPPVPPQPPPGPTAQAPPGAVGPAGMLQRGGQPYPNVGPFLSNLFGPNPRLAQQIGGSLGEGLKSVGANWNKPGLAAFAGSAGSAISGGTEADRKYFNELATATKINDAYNTAQTRTELARKKLEIAQQTGTVRGRAAAWQTSDIGRYNLAEKALQASIDGKRKELKTDLDSQFPNVRAKAQKQLEDFTQQRKGEIWGGFGLDPKRDYGKMGQPVYTTKDGKQVLDAKASGEQAFRPRTWEEFQATVPVGALYWSTKDGKPVLLRRKTEAPLPADHPASPLASIPDIGSEADEEATT